MRDQKKLQRRLVSVVLVLTSGFYSGCTGIKEYMYQDYSIKSINIDKESEVQQLLAAILALPEEKDTKFNFSACNDSTQQQRCQFDRNRIFARLIATSDTMCSTHLRTMYGNEASSNFILGSLTTIFTTLSTGASSMAAKTNLAAVGAISSAERSLINDVIYKGALVPAVHQKILETRQARRDNLSAIYIASYSSYPLERSVSDIVDYHYTCSFMSGLLLAIKEGTTNTQLLQLRSQVDAAESKLQQSLTASKPSEAASNPIVIKNTERFNALSDALTKAELSAAKVPPPLSSVSIPTPAASTPTPAASTPTPAASAPTPAASAPTPAASAPTPAASAPTPVALRGAFR